jgi:hypothetical protein
METATLYRISSFTQSAVTAVTRQVPVGFPLLKSRDFQLNFSAAAAFSSLSTPPVIVALQPVRTFSVSSGAFRRKMSDSGSGEEYDGGDAASPPPPKPAPKKPKNDQRLSVERIYQKKTQLEHILLRQVSLSLGCGFTSL